MNFELYDYLAREDIELTETKSCVPESPPTF